MAQQFNLGPTPGGILERALTGNIFVEKSLAYMNEGDKDGYNVYKHDIRNVLKARTDNPGATLGNTIKKEQYKRSLTVVETGESFDPADYYAYWKDFQPAGEFQWEGLPANVQASLELLFLGTAAEAVEDALTNGDAGIGVTGLIPQLEVPTLISLDGASPTATQITNNTTIAYRRSTNSTNPAVAITADNVFDILEDLIRHQTKEMRKRANRKFMMSHGTGDLVREAQRLKLNFKGVDVTEEGVMRYAGYDLIENPSFPDDTILFASMSGDMKTDAIQLGTSMSSDFNNLTVDRISNFNRKWGMVLTFALDIFVVRPEEICYYTNKDLS